MWTSEQGEHERAINDIKYPKPKCRIAYCGKNVEPFNDMLCFQHTQSKNPMEEKEGTNCPPLEEKKECKHNKGNYAKNGFLFCDNCDEVVPHPSIQEDKDCPNKGKVGGCPLCFITHHGEKDFQEDKDWEIEFSRHWIESEPFICTQKGRENAENRIKNFIKKTKQESYEEGKKDILLKLEEKLPKKLKSGMSGATDEYDRMLDEENKLYNQALSEVDTIINSLKKD